MKGSALSRVVTYANNQKPYMENYLLDGRCALSNNAAENAIRPFTVGRKNWLFADTPKGADASVAVYSLVETAKAKDDDNNNTPPSEGNSNDTDGPEENVNKGTLTLDATCAPANIRYPQDLSLLNEARKKLETIIY